MKVDLDQMRNNLGIALIATGFFLGIALQLEVHAQQSSAPVPAPVIASSASSATLKLENGKLEIRQLKESLSDTIHLWANRTRQAEWLGYSVAQISGERSLCCEHDTRNDSDTCGECRLESHNYGENISTHTSASAPIGLEGPREFAVLFRAESGKIGQIRILSMNCAADAGGLKVVWLGRVNDAESVNLLEKFALGENLDSLSTEKVAKGALTAIALHADSSADRALESFVAANQSIALRKDAVFWLGEARGADGLRLLRKMSHDDPDTQVREQITFAFSISKEPGALSELIRMAHEDESARVRGQALFWLGQKAGQKAAQAISGAIDNDPDTDVKRKAVFALSQMPPKEGVPKLISVAQTNRNPQVRKEAMFWLGQSEDPQALAFLEKILTH
jgi:hypothetical protein